MAREIIDIEALLIRAYHEKKIDRFGDVSDRSERAWRLILLPPSGSGGGGGGGLGVQTSGYAPSMEARASRGWAMLEEVDGSLSALHDAVLALPTFWLEPHGGLDFTVWDAETALQVGHRITPGKADGVVERVRLRGGKEAARASELRPAGPPRRVLPIVATTLMIVCGRQAERPYVPPVVIEGHRPVYAGTHKGADRREPVYETPLAEIVAARAAYATWHCCLGLLAAACGALPSVAVTGPMAPPEPWHDEAVPDMRPVPGARRKARAKGKKHTAAMG